MNQAFKINSAALRKPLARNSRRIGHHIGRRSLLSISVMALFSAAAISTGFNAHAADDKAFTDLQNENARLKQIVERLQQQINAQKPSQTGTQTPDSATDAASTTTTAGNVDTKGDTAQLDKVVINAERNPLVELRDVPKSISVVTGEELDRTGTLFLGDMLKKIGNVNWNAGNPRTGSLSLRGLTVATGDAIDPSVGVNVDGVSYAYNPLSTGSDFTDVDSVSVTRGPQGALGGKSTSLGQITVMTRRPTFTPEANASVTLGQRNTVRTQAAFGGPIVDGLLAYRITFSRDKQDGIYTNSDQDINGRQSYNSTDKTFARAQLLLTPTPDFNARLSFDIQPHGDEFINGTAFRKPLPPTYADGSSTLNTTNPATEVKLTRRWFAQEANYSPANYLNDIVYLDNNGAIVTGTKGASTELNWTVANHLLTSLTAYKDHYFSAANDDGTPFNVSRNGGFIVKYRQVSQEFRISSLPGSVVDYVGGLYYFASNNDSISRTRYGSDYGAMQANNAQYASLDADSAGRQLLSTLADRVYKVTSVYAKNKSSALFGQADWHLTQPLTLTTGARLNFENRRTTQYILVPDNGVGAALNPVSSNDVQLGGFNSNATTGALTSGGNSTAQLNLADMVANQYYGAALTGVPGAAYNSLTAAQKIQVANAKTIRTSILSGLYKPATASPYKGTLPTFNASLNYKFDDNLTTYFTWQHGAKAGISQINGATTAGGKDTPVQPEKSNTFEIGIKSGLLDNTLLLNADVFVDNIRNFQQTVYYFDATATAIANASGAASLVYSSGSGNVAKVQVKGLEFDATYNGLKNTSLRLAGAYNDARYKDFQFSAQPSENGYAGAPQFRDVTGKTLPNAPKFTFNLSGDYRLPVLDNKEFHAGINYRYTSRYNADTALSDYGWIKSYGVTDLNLGLGRKDKLIDVTLLVNNLFNIYERNDGWNTYSYTPAFSPRWVGIVISGRL